MEIQYNLDSDSDDDDDMGQSPDSSAKAPGSSVKRPNIGGTAAQIHDIEKLKLLTAELLDPAWKEVRNRNLIYKMLDLEDPTINPKVIR